MFEFIVDFIAYLFRYLIALVGLIVVLFASPFGELVVRLSYWLFGSRPDDSQAACAPVQRDDP